MKRDITVLKIKQQKPRESNFELLRLVCMLFILLFHFICHGLKTAGFHWGNDIWDSPNENGIAITAFVVIAVNCFILISGYFGIKANPKGLFHLYIMCVCYCLFFGFLSLKIDDYSTRNFPLSALLPLSFSGNLWFISCYAILYLLSPMLNKFAAAINKREFIVVLILWCVVTFWFGFARKVGNVDGLNVLQFIFVYLIGRFIYLHVPDRPGKRWQYFAEYIFCSLLIAATGLLLHSTSGNGWLRTLYGYNNPFVIASAVAFFLWFRTFRFQSRIINWCAPSALAIYLISESFFVGHRLYMFVYNLRGRINNELLLDAYLLALAIGIMIACILFDRFRMLLTNPLEKLFNKIDWNGYIRKLIDRITTVIK